MASVGLMVLSTANSACAAAGAKSAVEASEWQTGQTESTAWMCSIDRAETSNKGIATSRKGIATSSKNHNIH